MADKNVNYTDEMVARLHEVYDKKADVETRDEQVAQLAQELGKSPASIRAKLTREGIYVPKGKVDKAGEKVVRKADLVAAIAERLDVAESVIESLEKATKVSLKLVLRGLIRD